MGLNGIVIKSHGGSTLRVSQTPDGFLREMRMRFPDATARALPPGTVKADPFPTGSLPAIVGLKRVEASR